MTTSAPATAKKNVDTEVQYAESVIAWNVKMLLTAQNKSQSALAAFLGIQRPTMTNKMKGELHGQWRIWSNLPIFSEPPPRHSWMIH